jgi:SET domain-containing protein
MCWFHGSRDGERYSTETRSFEVDCVSYPQVSVRGSSVHGLGVFADEAIPAVTVVLEYTGERISPEEARRREAATPGITYILWYDDEIRIDGAVGGNEARFVNHSCEPNCLIRREEGRAFLETVKPIRSGEELTFDYSFDRDDEKVPCRCGAPGCRGFLNQESHPEAGESPPKMP